MLSIKSWAYMRLMPVNIIKEVDAFCTVLISAMYYIIKEVDAFVQCQSLLRTCVKAVT